MKNEDKKHLINFDILHIGVDKDKYGTSDYASITRDYFYSFIEERKSHRFYVHKKHYNEINENFSLFIVSM